MYMYIYQARKLGNYKTIVIGHRRTE